MATAFTSGKLSAGYGTQSGGTVFWVDYDSLKKVVADLKAVDKNLPKQVTKGNKAAANLIADGARANIHSKSHRLANSIRARGTQTNAKVIYNIHGALPYGTLQEYGGGVLWYTGGGGKARGALYSLSSGKMTYARFAAGGAQGLEHGKFKRVPIRGQVRMLSINPMMIKPRKRTQYGGYYVGESVRANLPKAFDIIRENVQKLIDTYLK